MTKEEDDKIIEEIREKKITTREFLYRMFFTRDDSLDLLQLFFLLLILFFMAAFALDSMGKWTVKNAAWTIFGTVFGTLAIAGVPTWIAQILAKQKTPTTTIKDDEEVG
jgi:hypothetical protein